MSEEEKKAIAYLKSLIVMTNDTEDFGENNPFKILNNLIENQQKELELKDKKIATLKVLNEELKYEFENYKNDKDIKYLDVTHHKALVEKSIGQMIDNPEECWFDAIEVKVIYDNLIFGVNPKNGEDFVNLKQIANKFNDNCITVIAESPLSGAIYRYNNYGKKEWQLIGTMYGYA